MEERYLESILKQEVERLVKINIENEIKEKVTQFERDLLDRKDKYTADVMKGIRILHERNMEGMTYKIIFENTQKIEMPQE